MQYEQIKETSAVMREARDCSVIAVALATGESYEMAHYALAEAGRKPRRGVPMVKILTAIELLGYSWHRIGAEAVPGRTPITLERSKWNGRYVVEFATHVAAFINGKVEDWTRGRRHRIQALYCITKN